MTKSSNGLNESITSNNSRRAMRRNAVTELDILWLSAINNGTAIRTGLEPSVVNSTYFRPLLNPQHPRDTTMNSESNATSRERDLLVDVLDRALLLLDGGDDDDDVQGTKEEESEGGNGSIDD